MKTASRTNWVGRLFLLLLCGWWLAAAETAAAESITSFQSALVVGADGSVLVTETIDYDFGVEQRHGIFRDLSTKHHQPASVWYKERYLEYTVVSVLRNRQPEPFVTSGRNMLQIKIGNPDKTITGQQQYEITYEIKGVLAKTADGQLELYHNATGDNWPVTIEQVQVVVQADTGVTLRAASTCYQGVAGDTYPCDAIIPVTEAADTVTFTADRLLSGQQLTVAQAVDLRGVYSPLERWNWWLSLWGGLGVVVLVVLEFVRRLYRWTVRYRPNAPIIVQYEPYQDFKPMYTGVLFDKRLDSRDITAGIVYLAQQGFIRIRHIEEKGVLGFTTSDYHITLLRPAAEAVGYFEQDLLALLFADQLSIEQLRSLGWWEKVTQKSPAPAAADYEVGKTVALSDIKKNTSKTKTNYTILTRLRQDVQRDLQDDGYTEKLFAVGLPKLHWLKARWFWTVVIFVIVFLPLVLFFVVFTAFVLLLSNRRTELGYAAYYHLLGFKDFLSVTDAERFKFHNAPEKNPEQFMEYLPFAIALGVDKEWSAAFADVAIAPPVWYESGESGMAFNAVALSQGLSSFSGSLASSSVGSSSSGSSGGGSAGGGSGGGGGGSW